APRCPTPVARDNGHHLPEKMRSNMETSRFTATPAQAGEVTTFYAYDGAGARSRALVNAAWLLSGRTPSKTPVLMIDWDLDRLGWDALFCACPALFRSFAAQLTRRFAHVLVDCRSGRSAATSVCTALLPDKMVGVFTPEPRSLEGLDGVVRRALDYRCSHED